MSSKSKIGVWLLVHVKEDNYYVVVADHEAICNHDTLHVNDSIIIHRRSRNSGRIEE